MLVGTQQTAPNSPGQLTVKVQVGNNAKDSKESAGFSVAAIPISVRMYSPTRDWLVCRALVGAVSRLESAGGVRALEEDPGAREALAAAQARHAALHGGHAVAGAGDPRRVKCLHAHLAFALATGDEAIAGWILERAGAGYPDRCCLDAPAGDGQLAAQAAANWPSSGAGSS